MANPVTTNTALDTLFIGDVETREVIIASGNNCKKGQVLGIKTADNKYAICDKDNTDGTALAKAICVEAIDTSSTGLNADTKATVLVRGRVRQSQLVFASGENADTSATNQPSHRISLQDYGILVIDDNMPVNIT